MVWLFSHLHYKIVNMEPLRAAKLIDDGKRHDKTTGGKEKIRAACSVQLKQMNGIEHNSPIHISGPNAFVYEDITKHMGSKQKIVNVDIDLANQLAAEEGAAMVNSTGCSGEVKITVRLSDSSYCAMESEISFICRQCRLVRSI